MTDPNKEQPMTDTTNSSPRPWRVVAYDDSLQCDIYDANETPVCTMVNFSDPQSDAALIVAAVNERERLRDIVRRLEDEYEQMEGRDTVCNTDRTRRIEALFREAREALDALPTSPRNCDRFGDELDAQLAFLNEEWLISVDKDSMLEKDKFENWTDEMRSAYAKWLMTKTEGDNHAKND